MFNSIVVIVAKNAASERKAWAKPKRKGKKTKQKTKT